MSFITKTLYAVACDMPDCASHTGGSTGWEDTAVLAEDLACDLRGWQAIHTPTGDIKHYCPYHVHALCSRCHAIAIGADFELEDEGWLNPRRPDAICPDCVRH